jgi:hypothetical protein
VRRAIPITLGLVTAGAGGLTAALIRAGRRSGVTRAELDQALPGDDLVPGARVVMDRAVTLPAPPERVWPWLVQLGKERAGWYLPGWLERAVPRGRRSLRYLEADFQQLATGDEVPDWGPGEPRFRAMIVDPPRALVYLTARDREDGHRWPEPGLPYPDSVGRQLGAGPVPAAARTAPRAPGCTSGCASTGSASGRPGWSPGSAG